MGPLDVQISQQLNKQIIEIGKILDSDVMAIISPIVPGLDMRVRNALEVLPDRKDTLTIVIETPGGVSKWLSGWLTQFETIMIRSSLLFPIEQCRRELFLLCRATEFLWTSFLALDRLTHKLKKTTILYLHYLT